MFASCLLSHDRLRTAASSILFCLLLLRPQPANANTTWSSILAFRESGLKTPPAGRGRIAANNLQDSIVHQNNNDPSFWRVIGTSHKHLNFMQRQRQQRVVQPKLPIKKGSLGYMLRVGLAGGLAGAAGTAALFPLDSAKTLRQANPAAYKNVMSALGVLLYSKGHWHLPRAYRGLIPSTLGAIPSSALYFGAYETMKFAVQKVTSLDRENVPARLLVHSLSAASGNVLSSAIFVPKEAIKQQMQFMGNANIAKAAAKLCKTRGVRGLYSGYKPTLLRNIPTAALRFTLYEELKHIWLTKGKNSSTGGTDANTFDWGLFAAGAVAGLAASAFMTPVDVLKTRISTGTCPVDMSGCVQLVLREDGFGALYAGAGSRMVASAAFSAIGFGVFEAARKRLGVSESPSLPPNEPNRKQGRAFTRRQRILDQALTEPRRQHTEIRKK